MGNIYLNLVLRTQAIDYKEKHVQWAASSSEDVSASSGSEGEMDGGGHRGGGRGGGRGRGRGRRGGRGSGGGEGDSEGMGHESDAGPRRRETWDDSSDDGDYR